MRRSLRSGSAPPAVLKEQFQFLRTQITIQEGDSESSSTSSPELRAKEHKKADIKKTKRGKGGSNSLKLTSSKGHSAPNLKSCAPKSAESLLSKSTDGLIFNYQQGRSPKGSRLNIPVGDSGETVSSGKRSPTHIMTQDELNGNYLSPHNAVTPQKSPSFRRRKATTVTKVPAECNLVILGDLGVGKTAFAVRFVTKRYLHEYDPKLERTYERAVEVDGENTMVRLWDTVEKDWETFVDTADGFMIMYDITSVESFKTSTLTATAIRNSLLQNVRTIPVILLGNKKELEHGRKVSHSEGERFANAVGCSFMELSVALNSDNDIDLVIRSLVKQVQFSKNTTEEQSKNSSRRQSTAMHSIKSFLSKMK